MRRIHRVLVLATLIAIAPAMAGCSGFDPDSLNIFHLGDKKKLPGKRILLFPNGVPGVTQGIPPQYMKGYQDREAQEEQQVDASLGQTNTPANAAKPGNKTGGKAGERRTATTGPIDIQPTPTATRRVKPKVRRRYVHRRVRHKARHEIKREAKRTPATKPAAPQPATAQQQKLAPWPGSKPQQATTAPWPGSKPQQATTKPWPGSKPQQEGASAPWPSNSQATTTSPWPAAPPSGTFSK